MEVHAAGLLDQKQAAQILRCTPSALARWRKERRGPAFVRLSRLIRYRQEDLFEWIRASRIAPSRDA